MAAIGVQRGYGDCSLTAHKRGAKGQNQRAKQQRGNTCEFHRHEYRRSGPSGVETGIAIQSRLDRSIWELFIGKQLEACRSSGVEVG